MDKDRLSPLLDQMIATLLAQRTLRIQAPERVMRVVLSGEDLTTLPATLDCLDALYRNGYLLVLAFSHSAHHSPLHADCLQGLARRGIEVLCDSRDPQQHDEIYGGLYLPSLSSNSLSKIALGIRDNLVCRWAFHALRLNKPAIVTLNAECRQEGDNLLPPAFRARLANYAAALVTYGFTVIGSSAANAQYTLPTCAAPRLLTLRDVRQHDAGHTLHIGRHTLITPAARDEIRDRGIVIVQS